jgi:hypothetical protein
VSAVVVNTVIFCCGGVGSEGEGLWGAVGRVDGN